MEPAFTVCPPYTLTPKYLGFESRPFFAPLPPRFRAIVASSYQVSICLLTAVSFCIEPLADILPVKKLSQAIKTPLHTVIFHFAFRHS